MFPKIVGVANVIIETVVVGILSIYLSNQPGLYRELLISLFPPVHRDLVRDVLVDISQTLRAWIVGQLTTMFLLGGLAAIGFSILHVPYALTFGLFTGLVAIVPFFGTLDLHGAPGALRARRRWSGTGAGRDRMGRDRSPDREAT